MTRRLVAALIAVAIAAPQVSRATTLTSQQITPSNDGLSHLWDRRNSTTSRGQILFVGSNDAVYLYNGATFQSIQPTDPINNVSTNVFGLGSASTAGQVLGGWRRGAGTGWVSINGGTPAQVTLNPEAVSIGEGCVFMVLQEPSFGNHAFKIDPANGNRTKLSSGTLGANTGAFRVFSSGCSKAVWTWQPVNGGPVDIQYWNGTGTGVTVAEDVASAPSFAGGRIVYSKIVAGIEQVFVIDTNVSLTPVQLSAETDATKTLGSPQTDGRHVAWYRYNTNGTSPETAQIILNGGLAFPTGPSAQIDAFGFPFQLNRGQLLWKNASGTFSYDDGRQTFSIDPSPATTFEYPWLTDGFIAFFGLTPTGGADKDVFRITGTVPDDASQPSPPLLVVAMPGTAQVKFDSILGATSYNAYIAYAPGVTKDNYLSLPGGQKITGVTSPFTLAGIPPNTTYYVAITAVEGAIEGPSSRVASTTFVGNLTWQAVGGLSGTVFHSVAADPTDASYVYAGANGAVYRSTNGGITWTEVLTNATTGGSRVAALAVSGTRVFASMMGEGDIWRSPDRGTTWSRVLDASGAQFRGSLAINPANSNILYAGDFNLPGMTASDSSIIKSVTGGDSWFHTPYAPLSFDIRAATIAIDPVTPTTLYTGSNATPNVAKSIDSAGSWISANVTGGGEVRSLAIDPTNPNTIYASTRDKGVFKSLDAGGAWTAKNSGLGGVSTTFSGGANFNSILVDPTNPSLLHLGTGENYGYWLSVDGGETWSSANDGFGGTPAWINALAITPGRHLIAATETGLYLLSFAAAPVVTNVAPGTGHVGGGTSVTITGTGFESGATVTFGGAVATSVNVVSTTTITATTPAHSAGVVSVVVTNPDAQSGTLAGAFNYTNAPGIPTGVSATAQSTTSIQVSWSASAGATSYQVHRRLTGGAFEQIATPGTTSFTDTVAAGAAYAYFVRAVNGSGVSADSAIDVATTMTFTDHPLATGVVVKAAHLSELRTAVNHVRALANLSPAGFTDSAAPGVIVKAVHITEIRSALDAALTQLGVAVNSYTDASLNSVVIKALHVQEIRSRIE
jgi:hypothetical protein